MRRAQGGVNATWHAAMFVSIDFYVLSKTIFCVLVIILREHPNMEHIRLGHRPIALFRSSLANTSAVLVKSFCL